jgi:retinol dehydrogenase 12
VSRVIVACRSLERANEAIKAIEQEVESSGKPSAQGRIRALEIDLSRLDSIDRAAQSFLALDLPLHVLILNAGLLPMASNHRSFDGFERYVFDCRCA